MHDIPFLIPPIAEQAAIIRYLDYIDQRIQRYIAAKQKLIGLLEEERQAIVNRAVTRGLNPDVRLKPSGVEWLGDVPEHWDVIRLKGHAKNVADLTRKLNRGDIYLSLEQVQSWTGRFTIYSDDADFDSQVKRFQAGDVLFGKLRPYLAKVVCPNRNGVCVSEFLVLRASVHQLSPNYLERLLRSKPAIDAIDASTFGARMPRADWRFIGDMRIPLPPLAEQTTIVNYLDKTTANIHATITRTRRQLDLMQEYRTRLIADVVTGKLDVREAAAQASGRHGEQDGGTG